MRFDPLLTLTPGVVRNHASAIGTCSGTLTNGSGGITQLTNAPVSYRATEVGTQESCELNADAPGNGELVFNAGALKFAIVEIRVAGTALLSLTGSRGGSAAAVAAVNSPNPATMVQQCAASGASSVPVNLTLQTTPAING